MATGKDFYFSMTFTSPTSCGHRWNEVHVVIHTRGHTTVQLWSSFPRSPWLPASFQSLASNLCHCNAACPGLGGAGTFQLLGHQGLGLSQRRTAALDARRICCMDTWLSSWQLALRWDTRPCVFQSHLSPHSSPWSPRPPAPRAAAAPTRPRCAPSL